MKTEYKFALL